MQGFTPIVQGHRAYDVLWILALALNDTMNEIQSGDINVTHPECEKLAGSLTSLENFTYSNAEMACILQENIYGTIFKGVTVCAFMCTLCVCQIKVLLILSHEGSC